MNKDHQKDLIIFNLLLGWEVIHLSKRGKKVTIRLREFPEKPNRFLRITFSKCKLAVIIDFNKGKQIEDFSAFDSNTCALSEVKMEPDGIFSLFLLGKDGKLGILKILSGDISFDFTSK